MRLKNWWMMSLGYHPVNRFLKLLGRVNSLHENCLKHANNWYRLLGNIDININFWCCLRLIEE